MELRTWGLRSPGSPAITRVLATLVDVCSTNGTPKIESGSKSKRRKPHSSGTKVVGKLAGPYPVVAAWFDERDTLEHKATLELVLDCEEPTRLAGFWREALGYREFYTDASLVVLVPREGIASPLLLQRVPESKHVKNRMHFDIVVDNIESEVTRLQAIGARRIDQDAQTFGGTRWVRMSDPEQNEFCVSSGVEW
jgi:hypothetical protein